jgi:hypothetical protein
MIQIIKNQVQKKIFLRKLIAIIKMPLVKERTDPMAHLYQKMPNQDQHITTKTAILFNFPKVVFPYP